MELTEKVYDLGEITDSEFENFIKKNNYRGVHEMPRVATILDPNQNSAGYIQFSQVHVYIAAPAGKTLDALLEKTDESQIREVSPQQTK